MITYSGILIAFQAVSWSSRIFVCVKKPTRCVIKQEIPFLPVSWLQRSTSTKNYERSIFSCLLLWHFLLLVISYYKQRRVFHTKTSSSSSNLGMVCFQISPKNRGNELSRLGVNNQASSEIADWDKIGQPCKSTTLHVTVGGKCSIQEGYIVIRRLKKESNILQKNLLQAKCKSIHCWVTGEKWPWYIDCIL